MDNIGDVELDDLTLVVTLNPVEIIGGFASGLVTSILVNEFFALLLPMYIDNTVSLPIHVRLPMLLFPFLLPMILVVELFGSIESYITAFIGILFSVFVMESFEVSEFAIIVAITGSIAWWIWKS